MDQKRNNVVVSRRAVMEAESQEERAALLDKLEEGQHVKGIVKNLTDYGAFVDLGGVDGLLHITDMSWKRVKHPSEVVNVGDEIDVKILKFDKERNRVSLGLKQMGDDPWSDITARYPENSRLSGKVSNITDYGCFVEIESGVEGLVHVSEMDWTNKNINPNKVVNLGDDVEVMVLEIDQERRRISLGMKQCQSNPWSEFAATHAVNDKIKGKIKSITDFGIFIGLDGSIDGLVHLSDISWAKTGEEAIHDFAKGQELETVILAIDPERERISLGIKQLESNPLGGIQTQFPKGSVVSGKIIEVDAKSAKVELTENITGFIKAADVAPERVKDVTEYLKIGEEIDAKVIGYDNKNMIINLSIKAMSEDNAEEAAPANATLGDLFKDKLSAKED
jgi:small subunit ribosomal protein S1